MRGFIPLLIALALLSGAVRAQNSSVTVTINSGTPFLMRNDYDGTDSSLCLSNLIGGQVPPGSQCILFDPVLQSYRPAIFRDRDGSWGPAGPTVLARGSAYWLRIPSQGGLVVSSSYQVTLSGVIPASTFSVTSVPQGNAVGYPYPEPALSAIPNVMLSSPLSSQLWVWNPTNLIFNVYSRSGPGGWGMASAVVLPPGSGCFVFRSGSATTNFLEPKPY